MLCLVNAQRLVDHFPARCHNPINRALVRLRGKAISLQPQSPVCLPYRVVSALVRSPCVTSSSQTTCAGCGLAAT